MRSQHESSGGSPRLGDVHFSRSREEVEYATEPYRHEMMGFDPDAWLNEKDNLVISDGCGNISMFEKGSDGLYTGHYFFVVRGKAALSLAKTMVEFFFSQTDAKAIRGLTPLTKLAARWMSRQIGFKGHGVVHTPNGPCELFIMTRN